MWTALQGIWDDAGVRFGAVDAGYLPGRARAGESRQAVSSGRGPGGCAATDRGAGRLGMVLRGRRGWCQARSTRKVDSGWLRLPAAPWCTRSWLHSLTSEHEEVVERSGRRVTVWKQHYRRNEALDTCDYALAIAELVPRPRRRRARLMRV